MSSPAPRVGVQRAPGRPALLQIPPPGDPAAWVGAHRDALRNDVLQHGALLIRGLGLRDTDAVAATFWQLGTLMSERESFAPRQHHGHGVYGSTKWPPNQPMCMHHELSYTMEFPGLMMFACLKPPQSGGATGVSDAPTILGALPRDLVDRFAREGWLLTRTYNEDIGASWEEAFGTSDRAAVEQYCQANGISFQWRAGGELRTRQRRSAIIRHPTTGQPCWFNQIAFLNQWTLDPDVREYLLEVFGDEGLPFNTRFGGGDPITEDIVTLLNQTYEAHTLREPWQAGDLLLVDNVRSAHSREPYTGDREILVGMADPVQLTDCSPTVAVR